MKYLLTILFSFSALAATQDPRAYSDFSSVPGSVMEKEIPKAENDGAKDKPSQEQLHQENKSLPHAKKGSIAPAPVTKPTLDLEDKKE